MKRLLCSKFHSQRSWLMTPLRQRMTEDMQVRNLAHNTQMAYLQQVSQFARHFNKSPEMLGPEDIRALSGLPDQREEGISGVRTHCSRSAAVSLQSLPEEGLDTGGR